MALKKSELYSSLWASCDELRSSMDASQYKDYALVLLFVTYVSDKYAGVPFAPITIPDGASFKDMVRPTDANPIFMGYYCNTEPIKAQMASKGQGHAVVHISAAALASVELRLPPLPEQLAIATILSDMDAEISTLEARRAKTRDLKQAMMQELLTGRTRLV